MARGRLREILAGRLRVPPRDVRFRYGEHGKPALDGVAFNLSHSGDLAALAIADEGELGVDIELVRPLREPVAEHYFSPAENRALEQHPEDQREAAFFRCWTQKEAFIKALGTGLRTPLKSFDVTFATDEAPRLLRLEGEPDGPAEWTFWRFQPRPDCMGAAAVRAPQASFRLHAPAWPLTTPRSAVPNI